jgi:hypothetical protein
VRLPRFKRQPQRHSLTQQMLLTDNLSQPPWAQAFGQRLVQRRKVGNQDWGEEE